MVLIPVTAPDIALTMVLAGAGRSALTTGAIIGTTFLTERNILLKNLLILPHTFDADTGTTILLKIYLNISGYAEANES